MSEEKNNKKLFVTAKQAESCLLKGKYIHTFRNPNGMLIGCDWSRKSIIELFNKEGAKIEIGGDSSKSLKHALIVYDGSYLFIECDMDKLEKLETKLLK